MRMGRVRIDGMLMIVVVTAVVSFVAYRLIFYRTRTIPFVKPDSPFTVDPASVEPVAP